MTEEFNLFDTIKMNENSHTHFLVHLLKNYPFITNKFLRLCVGEEKGLTKLETELEINEQENFTLEDGREGSIDIFIESNNNEDKFVCVIENKLDAKPNKDEDGKSQFEKYRDFVKERYENCKHPFFIILYLRDSKNYQGSNYTKISYSEVLKILYEFLRKGGCENDFENKIIEQYIEYFEYFEKYTGGCGKIIKIDGKTYTLWEKLCKELDVKFLKKNWRSIKKWFKDRKDREFENDDDFEDYWGELKGTLE